jgi:hypothetical protein
MADNLSAQGYVAIDVAKKSGLKNYPRYNELEDAVNFSKKIHDKIDKMGFLKK